VPTGRALCEAYSASCVTMTVASPADLPASALTRYFCRGIFRGEPPRLATRVLRLGEHNGKHLG